LPGTRTRRSLREVYLTLPGEREMMYETAALRYLLYYLRQEIAAGLSPDERTRRYLHELDELLQDVGLIDEDADSPEQRNRRDLEELLRWLP
jgi:hypothetical protein